MEFYNEATKETQIFDNTYTVVDGIMTVTIQENFTDGQKFQVKISLENDVIYRGKAIVTSQVPQNFEQTKDLYFYE